MSVKSAVGKASIARAKQRVLDVKNQKNTVSDAFTGGGNISGYASLKDMSIGLAGGGSTKGGKETPVRRYTETPYEEAMGDAPTEFTEKDADKIRRTRYKQAQGQIDSVNEVFDQRLATVKADNLQNTGRTRAVSARGGLTGSGRGEGMRAKTEEYNRGNIADVEAQRMEKVNSIFADIDARVDREVEARRLEVAGQREAYGTFLKEQTESARQQMSDLASLGVTLDELAPEDKEDFLKYTGMDELTFKTAWNKMLPKEAQIDYKYEVTDRGILAYGINPKTGALETQTYAMPSELAPGEELKEFDGVLYAVSKDANGRVVMRPISGGGGGGGGNGGYVEGANPEVDAWVQQIASGAAKIGDVPAKLKGAVVQGLAETATGGDTEKIDGMLDVRTLAEELKTMEGKGGAIGFGIKKTIASKLPGIDEDAIAGTDRATYEAKAKQLIDSLAATNLDKLKGAMSDKDIEFLRNIGSSLKFDMTEKAWDAELEKIINKLDERIATVRAKSGSGDTVDETNIDEYLDANPEVDAALQQALQENPNMTDEEILYFINGK